MSSDIPLGFVDLKSALNCPNAEVNIMGVVTDFLPPGLTKGTDWMSSFCVSDSSLGGIYDDGPKVRFFKPIQNELPAIRGTGDVVLLRAIRMKEWQGMTIGMSSRATTWVVFPADSIPAKAPYSYTQLKHAKDPRAPPPTPAEMQYAISLCNSRDRSTFTIPISFPSSSSPTSNAIVSSQIAPLTAIQGKREKFSLIQDVNVGTYYDLVGQVVKVFPNNGRVELYVTDYTSNRLLWNYEWGQEEESGREDDPYNYIPRDTSKKKWPGPYGKMTLTVTLWPPHSYFGQNNLKVNDFAHLRNVHIKWSKDAKVEGGLHSDRYYPDRIGVTILKNIEDDDRVKDILRRKRDYWKKFESQAASFVSEARALKRKEREEGKSLSKREIKKRRRQEREQSAKAKLPDAEELEDKENKDGLQEHTAEAQKPVNLPQLKSQKQDLNRNVNCSHHLIAPRSLLSILALDTHVNTTPEGTSYTMPFQNINSRATVRVIDFFPSNLADFAVRRPKASEYDILSELENSECGSEGDSPRSNLDRSPGDEEAHWEWRFGLVLEDAMGPKGDQKATMEAYVVGQDAECLLKLDAEDLRKSPTALATLREKLFLLWGDLEERKRRRSSILTQVGGNSSSCTKEEVPKSRAFQCCLKEYGVKKMTEERGEESGSESEAEHSERQRNWIWKRRWRMFGCTIV